jgi:hypothetical protein
MKSRRMRLVGNAACMGGMRNTYKILVQKPEGNRPRCRWEDNIRMVLQQKRVGRYELDASGSG